MLYDFCNKNGLNYEEFYNDEINNEQDKQKSMVI